MSAWEELSEYLYLLLGSLYVICSIGLFVFGVRVAGNLSERRERSTVSGTAVSSRRSIIRRVVLLTATCPLILMLRGVYSLLVGSSLLSTFWPPSISRVAWDSIVYFFSELVPSLLFIFMFWPSSEPASSSEIFSSIFSSSGAAESLLASPLLKENPQQWVEAESRLDAQLLRQNQ
jgi:hypothetical protein